MTRLTSQQVFGIVRSFNHLRCSCGCVIKPFDPEYGDGTLRLICRNCSTDLLEIEFAEVEDDDEI
jgi:hypothetical protein